MVATWDAKAPICWYWTDILRSADGRMVATWAAKEPICWCWTDDLLILDWVSAISSADDVQYYAGHVDIWEQRMYLISWWCRIVAAWNRFAVDKEPRNQLMKHVADTEQAYSCWTKDVCSADGTWLLWSALITRCGRQNLTLEKPLANRRIFLWDKEDTTWQNNPFLWCKVRKCGGRKPKLKKVCASLI